MGYGEWHDEWGASMMRERTGGFEKGPQNPLSLVGCTFSSTSKNLICRAVGFAGRQI